MPVRIYSTRAKTQRGASQTRTRHGRKRGHVTVGRLHVRYTHASNSMVVALDGWRGHHAAPSPPISCRRISPAAGPLLFDCAFLMGGYWEVTFFRSSRTAFPTAPNEHYPKVQERQLILRVDKKKQKKSSSSSTSLWHDLGTTTTRAHAPSLIARDHPHASESAIAFIVASGGGGACRAILIAGLCAASRSFARRMPPSEGLWSTSPASPRAGMCGEIARALCSLGVWDCLGP